MTVIARVKSLTDDGYSNPDFVGLIITSGFKSSYEIIGIGILDIESVDWFPENPTSVAYSVGPFYKISDTTGTFSILVEDNYLDDRDRAGRLSFKLISGARISFPVLTYGPVSGLPLWRPSNQGLITG